MNYWDVPYWERPNYQLSHYYPELLLTRPTDYYPILPYYPPYPASLPVSIQLFPAFSTYIVISIPNQTPFLLGLSQGFSF